MSCWRSYSSITGLGRLKYLNRWYGVLHYKGEGIYFGIGSCQFDIAYDDLRESLWLGDYLLFEAVAGDQRKTYKWRATKVWKKVDPLLQPTGEETTDETSFRSIFALKAAAASNEVKTEPLDSVVDVPAKLSQTINENIAQTGSKLDSTSKSGDVKQMISGRRISAEGKEKSITSKAVQETSSIKPPDGKLDMSMKSGTVKWSSVDEKEGSEVSAVAPALSQSSCENTKAKTSKPLIAKDSVISRQSIPDGKAQEDLKTIYGQINRDAERKNVNAVIEDNSLKSEAAGRNNRATTLLTPIVVPSTGEVKPPTLTDLNVKTANNAIKQSTDYGELISCLKDNTAGEVDRKEKELMDQLNSSKVVKLVKNKSEEGSDVSQTVKVDYSKLVPCTKLDNPENENPLKQAGKIDKITEVPSSTPLGSLDKAGTLLGKMNAADKHCKPTPNASYTETDNKKITNSAGDKQPSTRKENTPDEALTVNNITSTTSPPSEISTTTAADKATTDSKINKSGSNNNSLGSSDRGEKRKVDERPLVSDEFNTSPTNKPSEKPMTMPRKSKKTIELEKLTTDKTNAILQISGADKLETSDRLSTAVKPVTTITAPSKSNTTDTADKPTPDQPTADKPTADESTANKSAADISTADKSTADKPTADKPTVDKPTADKPTADKPTNANYQPEFDKKFTPSPKLSSTGNRTDIDKPVKEAIKECQRNKPNPDGLQSGVTDVTLTIVDKPTKSDDNCKVNKRKTADKPKTANKPNKPATKTSMADKTLIIVDKSTTVDQKTACDNRPPSTIDKNAATSKPITIADAFSTDITPTSVDQQTTDTNDKPHNISSDIKVSATNCIITDTTISSSNVIREDTKPPIAEQSNKDATPMSAATTEAINNRPPNIKDDNPESKASSSTIGTLPAAKEDPSTRKSDAKNGKDTNKARRRSDNNISADNENKYVAQQSTVICLSIKSTCSDIEKGPVAQEDSTKSGCIPATKDSSPPTKISSAPTDTTAKTSRQSTNVKDSKPSKEERPDATKSPPIIKEDSSVKKESRSFTENSPATKPATESSLDTKDSSTTKDANHKMPLSSFETNIASSLVISSTPSNKANLPTKENISEIKGSNPSGKDCIPTTNEISPAAKASNLTNNENSPVTKETIPTTKNSIPTPEGKISDVSKSKPTVSPRIRNETISPTSSKNISDINTSASNDANLIMTKITGDNISTDTKVLPVKDNTVLNVQKNIDDVTPSIKKRNRNVAKASPIKESDSQLSTNDIVSEGKPLIGNPAKDNSNNKSASRESRNENTPSPTEKMCIDDTKQLNADNNKVDNETKPAAVNKQTGDNTRRSDLQQSATKDVKQSTVTKDGSVSATKIDSNVVVTPTTSIAEETSVSKSSTDDTHSQSSLKASTVKEIAANTQVKGVDSSKKDVTKSKRTNAADTTLKSPDTSQKGALVADEKQQAAITTTTITGEQGKLIVGLGDVKKESAAKHDQTTDSKHIKQESTLKTSCTKTAPSSELDQTSTSISGESSNVNAVDVNELRSKFTTAREDSASKSAKKKKVPTATLR